VSAEGDERLSLGLLTLVPVACRARYRAYVVKDDASRVRL